MSNKIIIAIDGTSSTGKSTLAKRLAKKLNYKMYWNNIFIKYIF